MNDVTKVMKALSDESRVKMLKALEVKEMCVCELRELLGLAQPTVSKHLKVLVDAGLVLGRREGAWMNYRLAVGADSQDLAGFMLRALAGWAEEDPVVRNMKFAALSVNREQLKPDDKQTK